MDESKVKRTRKPAQEKLNRRRRRRRRKKTKKKEEEKKIEWYLKAQRCNDEISSASRSFQCSHCWPKWYPLEGNDWNKLLRRGRRHFGCPTCWKSSPAWPSIQFPNRSGGFFGIQLHIAPFHINSNVWLNPTVLNVIFWQSSSKIGLLT